MGGVAALHRAALHRGTASAGDVIPVDTVAAIHRAALHRDGSRNPPEAVPSRSPPLTGRPFIGATWSARYRDRPWSPSPPYRAVMASSRLTAFIRSIGNRDGRRHSPFGKVN